jgi:hypothetical protein
MSIRENESVSELGMAQSKGRSSTNREGAGRREASSSGSPLPFLVLSSDPCLRAQFEEGRL